MGINPNHFVKLYIVIFLLSVGYLSYKVYEQVVFVQKQRNQLTKNFFDARIESSYEDSTQKKFKQRKENARKIMKMQAIIKQVNLQQKIYNEHLQKLDPIYIIVIQVHSNVPLFKQLLISLRQAYEISTALLIFSHDVFDPEINKAVHSVTFAKYMQIFFPFSIQLHPNVFPGNDPDNDDRKMREQTTTNHAREAAQKKHHWWWQMHQVFDHLNITKKHKKPILILEEDNYVTLDFLIVFNILQSVKRKDCPGCEMISLGAHMPLLSLYKEKASITFEMWEKNTPNIGIAIDRVSWNFIKNHSHDFCYFDDYRWDNSLKYVGSKHLDTNFYLTTIDGPRVFRVETCSDTDLKCRQEHKIKKVLYFTELIRKWMFPVDIKVDVKICEYYEVKPRGFFNDTRDHELCMHFTKNNVWY